MVDQEDRIEARKVCLQLVSMPGDGMHLEICAANSDGTISVVEPYPLALFRVGTDGAIQFEFESPHGIVSIPASELRRALDSAEDDVRGEEFYK